MDDKNHRNHVFSHVDCLWLFDVEQREKFLYNSVECLIFDIIPLVVFLYVRSMTIQNASTYFVVNESLPLLYNFPLLQRRQMVIDSTTVYHPK